MKPSLKTLLASAALTVISVSAMAQASAPGANTPRVDQRQAHQEQRIDKGVASGALTPHETRRLTHEQNAIDRVEDKAKADGSVTAQERKRLHHLQNRASRDIKHQKHDRQRAARPAGA